jgi:hypothetical protein
MSSKQPFYHRVTLLFTSTSGCGEEQFLEAFQAFMKSKSASQLGIVPNSLTVETYEEPEPGDPADLL